MQADAVGHSHSASQRNEYTKAQAPENLQLGLHDNKTVIIVHLLYPPIIAEDGHNIMSLTTKLFAQYVRCACCRGSDMRLFYREGLASQCGLVA